MVCQNGGTVFGDMQCACPVQYSGRYCERYIRVSFLLGILERRTASCQPMAFCSALLTMTLMAVPSKLEHRDEGFVSEDQQIASQLVRSQVDCADQCLRTMDCKAVNVFPYDDKSGLTNCSLIGVHNPGICDGLSAAVSKSSYFMQKVRPILA
nr:hypothetical protein BaRGS_014337 [Batillaria attramentaria]